MIANTNFTPVALLLAQIGSTREFIRQQIDDTVICAQEIHETTIEQRRGRRRRELRRRLRQRRTVRRNRPPVRRGHRHYRVGLQHVRGNKEQQGVDQTTACVTRKIGNGRCQSTKGVIMSIYYRGLFAKNADILNELAAASGYKLVTDQENGEFWLEADAEASETMMIDNPAEWPLAVLQFSRMVERERAAAELLRLSQAIASAIHFLKSGIIANEDRVAEVRSLQRAISPFKGLVAQLQDDSLWT